MAGQHLGRASKSLVAWVPDTGTWLRKAASRVPAAAAWQFDTSGSGGPRYTETGESQLAGVLRQAARFVSFTSRHIRQPAA